MQTFFCDVDGAVVGALLGGIEHWRVIKSACRRYYLRPAYMARALWRLAKRPALVKNHLLGFYYWLGLMRAG